MSTGVAPAVAPSRQARIGSFFIVERLNPHDATSGQITLKVAGIAGSSFAGRDGIATCFNAPEADAARQRVEQLLESLKTLAHPAIWPVMDVGTSGSVIYWIRSLPTGESLEATAPSLSVREVGSVAQSIASGLQVAHANGLSHGNIQMSTIRRFPSGAWTLYGLGIMGRGPANDQYDLGRVAVGVLSGRPWIEPDMSGYPEAERAYHRAQRLREQLGNTTERVVNVINRAMQIDPAQRYESIAAFGEDLVNQIRLSGDDLVHGAFEAISARNVEMARIMASRAAVYNPDSDNLAVLNVQLNGGSAFGQAAPAVPVFPGAMPFVPPSDPAMMPPSNLTVAGSTEAEFQPQNGADGPAPSLSLILPAMQSQTGPPQSSIPPELVQGLPPEMVEMFAAQFQQAPQKKGINPMFVLFLGGLGMVVLLLVAALVTFFATGA